MKKWYYIIFCLIGFLILTFIYFNPIISGKKISQHDIVQFQGGASEMKEYREQTGNETYWTNSMFSGMPTYQAGAQYPAQYIKELDRLLRFTPSPVSYIFLLFSGFFFLIMVWLKDWRYALLGGVSFALSTYFFIIIAAGHNSKINCIAYFAPFVAGVYLLYEKKYFYGFLVTTIFLALQLVANHPQMTYYLFLGLGIFVLIQFIDAIKQKHFKPFIISSCLFGLSIALALGMNSQSYLATYEYGKESIRGKSELTSTDSNKTKNGLDKSYITDWSYGIGETLNLFIPNLMGGGSHEKSFKGENTIGAITSMGYSPAEAEEVVKTQISSYWGEQPGTSGPAYQGAVVIFLAILGLFFYKGKYKWWLVAASILSIVLAWGKNFGILTDFLIDHFPFYNKFRAVSSALVLAEFTVPTLAVLGLYAFYNNEEFNIEAKRKRLLYITGGVVLFLILLLMGGSSFFDFHSSAELEMQLPPEILSALEKDRLSIFRADILRTLLFVILIVVVLYFSLMHKLNKTVAILIITVLSLVDLWGIDQRYLNEENFVDSRFYKNPFPTVVSEDLMRKAEGNSGLMQIVSVAPINKNLELLKEKDKSNYRVFNMMMSPFNENTTSNFHQSIGGYHGVKLRRYQDIIDHYLSKGIDEQSFQVLNMLNTKYIIREDSVTGMAIIPNPLANGNAWFVQNIISAKSPDEEIQLLGKINNKKEAIVRATDLKQITQKPLGQDSTAFIKLTAYQPNHLNYKSSSQADQMAVFSEIYYPYGWKAYVDNQEVPIYQVNYTLRGVVIPKGQHEIQMKFEPEVIKKGAVYANISYIVFVLIAIGWGFWLYKKKKKLSL